MDLRLFIELLTKALEKSKEEQLFQQWCVQLPLMATAGKYTSFEEYRDKMLGKNIDKRSKEELLREIEEIEKEFTNGKQNI